MQVKLTQALHYRVTRAMEILNDIEKKALHPLMGARAKFNLPAKLAIQHSHTYIALTLLYSVENWTVLSDLDIQRLDNIFLFKKTDKACAGTLYRKLLQHVLGVFKTGHNISIYEETVDIPISLKGYRLMLNY